MSISERIFKLLQEKRFSQKELADCCGASERAVSSWRTRGSDPPAKLIPKIATFLGVSVIWLLTGEDGPDGDTAKDLGTNSGVISARGERVLSEEESELLRLYGEMTVRDRLKLLSAAYEIGGEDIRSS